MTKKEFLDLEQNSKMKKEIKFSAYYCYVCAVITAVFALSTGNYFQLIDTALILIFGLLIHFKQSLIGALMLLGYGLLNAGIQLTNGGSPSILITIVGGLAVYYTYKLNKEYKEYLATEPVSTSYQNQQQQSQPYQSQQQETVSVSYYGNDTVSESEYYGNDTVSESEYDLREEESASDDESAAESTRESLNGSYGKSIEETTSAYSSTTSDSDLEGHYLLYITRDEARNGCQKTISFDGEQIEVQVPQGARGDTVLVMPNCGYKNKLSGERGNLRIECIIM